MWIASKYGFFSIVQKDTDRYNIRTQSRQDIDNLLQVCKLDAKVSAWSTLNYRYQITINADELLKVSSELARNLDYKNFKTCIAHQTDQRHKLVAYHQISDIMIAQHDEEEER
jgi:hypothetical protein